MSTIKSSDEHLTLNADGSGNDIKFQSNGSEVASISDGGVVTATSFAGSGANLTGVGVAGISSSADATAITIDSSEQVGMANTSPNSYDAEAKNLVVGSGTGHQGMTIVAGTSSKSKIHFADGTGAAAYKGMVHYDHNADTLNLATSGNDRLSITSDGRGLSQFTAKVWCRFNGGGTPSFSDSYNCSSIADWGTGNYGIYIANGLANANYAVVCLVNDAKYGSLNTSNTAPQTGRFDIEVRTVDSNFGAEDVGYVSCLVFGD